MSNGTLPNGDPLLESNDWFPGIPMKNALLMLLAATVLAVTGTPADAQASTKKKVVVAKKHPARAVSKAKAPRKAKAMQRGASMDDAHRLALQSSAVLVQDQTTGAILLEKNPNAVLPIASITKLMTAMVLIAWQVPGESARASAGAPHAPASAVPAPAPAVPAPAVAPGYGAVWRDPYFRSLAPFGFVGYGGMVAIQTLWAAPWLVNVAGFTPVAASTAMFWLNVSMMLAFLVWGWVNPWLARKGWRAEQLMAWGLPVHIGLLLLMAAAGSSVGEFSGLVWTLFCVSGTVGTLAQPAIGMAFPSALAGRALSAFNLLIFSGVFAVQWGVGLLIDGLRKLGWTAPDAYQGAMGVFAICLLWTYVHLLRAKKR